MHSDKMLNILLVEDDEVDGMNIRRAFKKGNISNPLWADRVLARSAFVRDLPALLAP